MSTNVEVGIILNCYQNLGQGLMGTFEAEIFCEFARTYEIADDLK